MGVRFCLLTDRSPESTAERGEDFPEDTAAAFALMAMPVSPRGWQGRGCNPAQEYWSHPSGSAGPERSAATFLIHTILAGELGICEG